MARVTRAELAHYVESIERDAKRLGLIGRADRVVLDIGSQTYGRAYRLWTTRPTDSGGMFDGLGLGSDAFLGMTSSDARLSLRALATGLGLVVQRDERAARERETRKRARAATLAAEADDREVERLRERLAEAEADAHEAEHEAEHAHEAAERGERSHTRRVTCGSCSASWCETCDPAPAAQCHVCNGRGYSLAPLNAAAKGPDPYDPAADIDARALDREVSRRREAADVDGLG